MQVVDGRLLLISNHSAHCLPDKSYLEQATAQLHKQGIAPEGVDAEGGEAW